MLNLFCVSLTDRGTQYQVTNDIIANTMQVYHKTSQKSSLFLFFGYDSVIFGHFSDLLVIKQHFQASIVLRERDPDGCYGNRDLRLPKSQ